MMSLEIKKLAESWEYIQGGFLFLDETIPGEENALALANGELKYFIRSLSALLPEAKTLVEQLHLSEAERPFDSIPESLRIMLKQDLQFLKEDPAVYDESFGSIALVRFYERVSSFLNIPSPFPAAMRSYVEEETSASSISVPILWGE